MIFSNFINLFNKETLGTLLTAITIVKLVLNHLNSPLENTNELYKKANISTWRVRLFQVKISTKQIPKLTRLDTCLFSFLIIFLICSCGVSTFYSVRLQQIPEGWTSLILKETDELFLITTDKASEHSFWPGWHLTRASCMTDEAAKLVKDKKISPQLKEFICKILNNGTQRKDLLASIEEIKKQKPFLNFLLITISVVFLWLSIGILLTIMYTRRIRTYLLNTQQKAYLYLT